MDKNNNSVLDGYIAMFIQGSNASWNFDPMPLPASKSCEKYLGPSPLNNDTDNDGLLDGVEVAPLVDSDNDGRVNACDADSDGDGLLDGVEQSHGMNILGNDTNNDGVNDNAEYVFSVYVACSDFDADADGVPDYIDTDDDNDALPDILENPNGDAKIDKNETCQVDKDSDDDGIMDSMEYNYSQDSDGDGMINAMDSDSDNDGVLDCYEARVMFRATPSHNTLSLIHI